MITSQRKVNVVACPPSDPLGMQALYSRIEILQVEALFHACGCSDEIANY